MKTKATLSGRIRHGGEGEIRTHGTVSRTTDFKSVALDHSATSPCSCGDKIRHFSPFVEHRRGLAINAVNR